MRRMSREKGMGWKAYVERLGGEDDDFEPVREVAEEVVDAGTFGGAPAVLTLRKKHVW